MSVELKGHSVNGGKYTFSVPMIAVTYVQEQETMALKSFFLFSFFFTLFTMTSSCSFNRIHICYVV